MTKTQDVITLASDLKEYFTGEVGSTAEKQGIALSPRATQYLGGVLARYKPFPKLFRAQCER